MAANAKTDAGKKQTTVERKSDRELVVTRTFDAPVHIVFKAWSSAELFTQWWAPKSSGVTILSREMDIRTGGAYRLVMRHPSMEQPMAFFGRYLDVVPNERIVWTNDESGDKGALTTVTFEQQGDQTRVVLLDLYPSKEALDEAIASQATSGFGESFEQLDAILAA
jgi:uncharacterized protein YndB with AHSA1/START domain